MDLIVLLTPLLALAVVALLGFAGCSFEHGRLPSRPTLRVRVPAALAVTRVTFRWTPPGGSQQEEILADPTPVATEVGLNVFEHAVPDSGDGAWMSWCQVRVREGTQVGQAEAVGDFMLDGSISSPIALYQASGTPTGGNFTVVFVGVPEPAMT